MSQIVVHFDKENSLNMISFKYCYCPFKGTVQLDFLSFFFSQSSQTVLLIIGLKWFREIFVCKFRNLRVCEDNDYADIEPS